MRAEANPKNSPPTCTVKQANCWPRIAYFTNMRYFLNAFVLLGWLAFPAVAQALGMSEAVLGKWVRAARTQAARPAGSDALEQENKQLRAQLVRADVERASLKKALTIFPQPTGR